MSRAERWMLWGSTLLVGGTGVGYFWTKYLTGSEAPFSVIGHPLEPVFLKLHIVTAPLLVFALGTIAVRHVWRHYRSGVLRSRRSGILTALVVVPMVLTGYLIQVLTGEGWLVAMAWSHIGFGTLFLLGAGLHRLFLARSGRAAPSERELDVGATDGREIPPRRPGTARRPGRGARSGRYG